MFAALALAALLTQPPKCTPIPHHGCVVLVGGPKIIPAWGPFTGGPKIVLARR